MGNPVEVGASDERERARDSSIGMGVTTGFSLAVVTLLLSGLLSYQNLRRISVNEGLVVHTHEVLDELHNILASLTDAESGQRGYIITGSAPYVERYQSARSAVHEHVEHVSALTVDNPSQQARIRLLNEKVNQRLETLAVGIAERDQHGAEGGQIFVLSGRGKQEMDEVRAQVEAMVAAEMKLLAMREAQSRTSYTRAIVTLALSSALGLALVGTAYLMSAREVATRHASVEALRRANDELEERVRARTADLAETNQSLQLSNRELEQFASVASHDLQEPLRKIQAFGDRLQTKCAQNLGDQGRDYLERMQASATRMRSLIDALLSYSRVTTKAQPFVPVNLSATAEDVISDLEDRVQRTGGRIEVGELPTIEADALQMRQLLQNLI
ncbi:MAG: CHASE3 domain-containing protein, partial [Verrucomicrobiota bacterium]|nr:CHASE3 domain-containing protein [Verrucomicrobiota bacterium]